MSERRVKVIINCRQCGEKFTLRGKRTREKIETGFKRCICNNDHDFELYTEDL